MEIIAGFTEVTEKQEQTQGKSSLWNNHRSIIICIGTLLHISNINWQFRIDWKYHTINSILGQFGVCYWVSFGCCLAMIAFAIYYRWSKARYERFLIMEKLVT